MPRLVQVPENWSRGKISIRTRPRTARKYESVLEPEPEPPTALGQFKNMKSFEGSAPTLRILYIIIECVLDMNWSLTETKIINTKNIPV